MIGGAAGYRPRVRSAYYERVYVHSLLRDTADVSAAKGGCKGARVTEDRGLCPPSEGFVNARGRKYPQGGHPQV